MNKIKNKIYLDESFIHIVLYFVIIMYIFSLGSIMTDFITEAKNNIEKIEIKNGEENV